MFSLNQNIAYQNHMENSLLSNNSAPNTLTLQNSNMSELHIIPGLTPKEIRKSLKDSECGNDLIDFNENVDNAKQPIKNINKEEEISNYQIKMLEEFLSSTSSTKSQTSKNYTPEEEMQFQEFFDKYEASTKSNTFDDVLSKKDLEMNKTHSKNEYVNTKSNNNGSPMILLPKLHRLHIVDDMKENEDLIDEVLLEKNLEKRPFKNEPTQNKLMNQNTKTHTLRNCNVYPIGNRNGDIMHEIMTKNYLEFSALHEDEVRFRVTKTKLTEMNHGNLNSVQVVSPNNDKILNSDANMSKINDLVAKHNLKYLEAIKVDEKIFQKRSLLKSDTDLLSLTPGPTLYEKCVVLPQMMQRLIERNNTLEALRNMKPKLILDVGTSLHIPAEVPKNSKPVIDAIPNSSTFHDKLKFQTQPVTKFISKTNSISVVKPTVTKNNQSPIAHASGLKQFVGKISKDAGNTRFIPIEQLKAKRREDLLQSSLSTMNPEHPYVLRPPQVLMADCNRQRYVSHATSRIFADDFINGK